MINITINRPESQPILVTNLQTRCPCNFSEQMRSQINVCHHLNPLVIIVVVLYLSVGITELDLMEYPIEYLLPKLVSSCL